MTETQAAELLERIESLALSVDAVEWQLSALLVGVLVLQCGYIFWREFCRVMAGGTGLF